jgi:hypothetical protein
VRASFRLALGAAGEIRRRLAGDAKVAFAPRQERPVAAFAAMARVPQLRHFGTSGSSRHSSGVPKNGRTLSHLHSAKLYLLICQPQPSLP